jgi:hypothetical protein
VAGLAVAVVGLALGVAWCQRLATEAIAEATPTSVPTNGRIAVVTTTPLPERSPDPTMAALPTPSLVPEPILTAVATGTRPATSTPPIPSMAPIRPAPPTPTAAVQKG